MRLFNDLFRDRALGITESQRTSWDQGRLIRNRSISPFLRHLSFLSWFIPQEGDHDCSRGLFREDGVLV